MNLEARREFLCTNAPDCIRCHGHQVQLLYYGEAPASWRCRDCRCGFLFEPTAVDVHRAAITNYTNYIKAKIALISGTPDAWAKIFDQKPKSRQEMTVIAIDESDAILEAYYDALENTLSNAYQSPDAFHTEPESDDSYRAKILPRCSNFAAKQVIEKATGAELDAIGKGIYGLPRGRAKVKS